MRQTTLFETMATRLLARQGDRRDLAASFAGLGVSSERQLAVGGGADRDRRRCREAVGQAGGSF